MRIAVLLSHPQYQGSVQCRGFQSQGHQPGMPRVCLQEEQLRQKSNTWTLCGQGDVLQGDGILVR